MKQHAASALVAAALVAGVAAGGSARRGGPVAIASVGQMDCCINCPFTIPIIASIAPLDGGGGVIEAGIVVLSAPSTPTPHDGWSSYAPLPLTITRIAHDLHVRVDGPDAENGCTLHARITNVPRGTYRLHLEGTRDMHMAAPLGRPVPAGGELARTTVTVR
jgi:hypothetical protein